MKEFAITVLWIGYEARPEYLRKRGEDDSKKKRIARVRCGNFERPNRFLLEEDKKKWELCNDKEGKLKHCVTKCKRMEKLRGNMKGIGEGKYCE